MRNRRTAAAIAAAAVALLVGSLTACEPTGGPAGLTGKVVSKSTGVNSYKLTVRDAQGVKHTFKVPKGHYNRCYLNSSYPKCTKTWRWT